MPAQPRRPSLAQIKSKNLPYFHPDLRSMDEVSRLMEEWRGTDGSFVLRNSFRTPGGVSVSVWYCKRGTASGLKHFTIKVHQGAFYLQDDLFDSVEKLIQFYCTQRDVPNEEGLRGMRLTHPIPRHEYAEIPSKDGYEEFVPRHPQLPPRKASLPDRLSSCSDASSASFSSSFSSSSVSSVLTDNDSAFEDEVRLPLKPAVKKGFFSGGKSKPHKSTSDLPAQNKSRPLPPPPRMKSLS